MPTKVFLIFCIAFLHCQVKVLAQSNKMAGMLRLIDIFETLPKKNKMAVKVLAKKGNRCIVADDTRFCCLKVPGSCPPDLMKKYFITGNYLKIMNCQIKTNPELLMITEKTQVMKTKKFDVVDYDRCALDFPPEDQEGEEFQPDEIYLASVEDCDGAKPLKEMFNMRAKEEIQGHFVLKFVRLHNSHPVNSTWGSGTVRKIDVRDAFGTRNRIGIWKSHQDIDSIELNAVYLMDHMKVDNHPKFPPREMSTTFNTRMKKVCPEVSTSFAKLTYHDGEEEGNIEGVKSVASYFSCDNCKTKAHPDLKNCGRCFKPLTNNKSFDFRFVLIMEEKNDEERIFTGFKDCIKLPIQTMTSEDIEEKLMEEFGDKHVKITYLDKTRSDEAKNFVIVDIEVVETK